MACYVSPNYKSKKALKLALIAGEEVSIWKPSHGFGMGSPIPEDGVVFIEGPHYPAPHSWYAKGVMVGGKLSKVS